MTRRHLVLLDESMHPAAAARHFRDTLGLSVASTADITGAATASAAWSGQDGVLLHSLGVAVVDLTAAQANLLRTDDAHVHGILAVEPDRNLTPLATPDEPQTGTEPAAEPRATGRPVTGHTVTLTASGAPLISVGGEQGISEWTWGPFTCAVPYTDSTGLSVRVAVLATGIDPEHPDLADHAVYATTVVPDTDPVDRHGLGTHLTGIIAGPARPHGSEPVARYGIAPDADLYCCKITNDQGEATDSTLLAGLAWAVNHGVEIACIGVGAPTEVGRPYSHVIEAAARRALAAGVVLVAGTGDDSDRWFSGKRAPVSHPANCPSVLGVSALAWLNASFALAGDTNGGMGSGPGGQVDMTAPGYEISSAWPGGGYHAMSGTACAAAHTAGVAALVSQDNLVRGHALWTMLAQTARRLHEPAVDVGAGLATAP